jgi:hypothetical protein
MTLLSGDTLGRQWTGSEAAVPAVVTDAGVVHHRNVIRIYVMHIGTIHMRDVGVVHETVVMPVAAFITNAGVTGAVVHAAVKADVRTPVAVMPAISAAVEAPVARGPEGSLIRRDDPRARNPVVTGGRIGPVARSPDVVIARSFRLVIVR